MNLGTWLWAIPAIVLVAFGLFLSISEDPDMAPPGTALARYSEAVLVPEVSRVLSQTSAVEVRSERAEGEQRKIATLPQLPAAADGAAQSAESPLSSFAESSVTVSMLASTGVPSCEETNTCFLPTDTQVDVGGSVTWINDDSVRHTVWVGDLQADANAVGYDYPNGFRSGFVNPGDSFTMWGLKEGHYPYYCSVHPWRTGSITVGEGTAPKPPSRVTAEGTAPEPPRVTITAHSLPYGDICAFDAEGNSYGGSQNHVFRADVSEGVATKWIIPDDRSFYECGDTDSSGRFYFTTDNGKHLLRLNPGDDSFTIFSLRYDTDSLLDVDSSDNVHLQQPERTYVLEGSRQTKVFVSGLYLSVDYADDDLPQCRDRCFGIENVCYNACRDAKDACIYTCNGSQSCENACHEIENQCGDACEYAVDACDDACYAEPGRIYDNDSAHNVLYFVGSGVSGPATVTILSSNSSVLGTTHVLPRSDGTVYGSIQLPADIASGAYDSGSDAWNIPPGPSSTTGRYALVLKDLSQTASAVFELDPDKIIALAPAELDRHAVGTRYHFALAAKLDPATDNLTMFYSDVGHSDYRVISMDSGSLYLQDGNYIAKFDPESGKLLEWYMGSNSSAYAAYGARGDKVYYPEHLYHRSLLVELDTTENILRKWALPYHGSPYSIAVDGQGHVFLAFGDHWLKFTPSTGTFTEFWSPSINLFETGTRGEIYWASGNSAGNIQ